MLNIVRLDWLSMKYAWVRLIIIPLTLFAAGISSSIYLPPLSVFLFFCFSLCTFAAEEKGDLNRLYLTLPVKRSDIVKGRYILSFLLFLSSILLGFGLIPLENLVSFSKWYPDFRWHLAIAAFCFLLYSLFCLFMYPPLFQLGYLKGRVWGMYIPMLLFGLASGLFLAFERMPGNEKRITSALIYASEHILAVSGGMLVLGGSLFAISFLLSVRLYSKREF